MLAGARIWESDLHFRKAPYLGNALNIAAGRSANNDGRNRDAFVHNAHSMGIDSRLSHSRALVLSERKGREMMLTGKWLQAIGLHSIDGMLPKMYGS